LRPARGRQASVGARVALPYDCALQLLASDKALAELAVRTPESPPLVAQHLVAHGRGTARGISLMAQRALTSDLFFLLGYTLARAERSHADGVLRPFDYHQRHVLTSTLGYRFRALLAMPTPTRRAVPTSHCFGPANGMRLPTYFALDPHIEYSTDRRHLRSRPFPVTGRCGSRSR
jgi:hypothetical protein